MHFLTIISLLVVAHQAVAAPAAGTEVPEVLDNETFHNLTLPEYTPDGLKVIDLRSRGLEPRADCTNIPGTANGQCVNYYSASGCPSQSHVKGYKPTCAGNCYVDKFYSVKVSGDGTYSTNCDLYSDTNCQNRIGTVGSKTGGGSCNGTADGWSMKCWYRCEIPARGPATR